MRVKTSSLAIIIVVAIIIILPLTVLSSGFFAPPAEKICSGVEFMGAHLGGLNKEGALSRLSEVERDLRAKRVTLSYQDWQATPLLNEIGFELDKETMIAAALNVGKEGSLVKRWRERKQIEKTGLSLRAVANYKEEKLAQRVQDLTADIVTAPVDASFQVGAGGRVTVSPSQDGTGVDLTKLKKDIVEALHSNQQEVLLTLKPLAATRTTEQLQDMHIEGLLGGYTTHFDAGATSRTYNISVAGRAFDELLVRPGQVVSFNEIVGPRSFEAGYKTAPVIVNNELVDGLGGGVCQVSTTLYNSVLLANLEIVERYNHSMPISYVPIGRDATVVYDALDFKFSNNTADYLYLKSYIGSGQITINIYGNTTYKKDVRVEAYVTRELDYNLVYEDDPNLPEGTEVVKKEGAKGFIAFTERVVSENGQEIKRDSQSYSDYTPVNQVIAVGTGEAAPQMAPGAVDEEQDTPAGRPGADDNTGNGREHHPVIPGIKPSNGDSR
ncbi:MAG: vanomycin resistance protein VanB [Peptococcaceae bacterium]|nr:vanomycin resistance protein VanB [Candidatus Syntrophopropionicum ammoniitolerans]